MDAASRELLRSLQDRQEIEECLSRYAHGIDRHDEALIADVYHADARDWHGPFHGGVAEFVPWVNALHERKARAHTHNITTHWCEVRGDHAYADTYVLFVLYLRDREVVMMGSGRYIDHLEYRGGLWRIAQRRTITEIRLEAAAQRLADTPGGYPTGSWDRSDISYQRPLVLPPELRVPDSSRAIDPSSEAAPRTPDLATALNLLSRCGARRAIRDCITQSVRGLDRADRDLILQQFVPSAAIEDGLFHGNVESYTAILLARYSQEDIAVAHHLTSHQLELGNRSAAAETYVTLMRYSRDGATVWVGGLRLLDRLEKQADEWRIVSRRVVADWELEADGTIFRIDDQYLRGRRDRTDLSYERP